MTYTERCGVIFDVDGVLVDSYRPHLESWRLTAAKDSVSFTDEAFHQSFGRVSGEVVEMLWGRPLPPEKIDEIDRSKEAKYREIIETSFPAMPGAAELIRSLRDAGIGVAIGSSAPRENVEATVKGLDVGPLLTTIVCRNDVSQGKPDPEIFLRCAERLGLPPDRCIVIEDSIFGIQAAKAAGMFCVGFHSTGHRPDEYAHADTLIHSLQELDPNRIQAFLA